MKEREVGSIVKRYPGGDPENGPAYRQRYLGDGRWECAAHRFECYEDFDPETKERYTVTQCCYCGDYAKGQ